LTSKWTWTDSQRAELARQYARVGYVQGELWPAAPDTLSPTDLLELFKTIPSDAGREGYMAALKSGGKPVPVDFVANNELALHVADPEAAEKFYTEVLGCTVFERAPDCISLSNGPLKLYLLRDPATTHGAVVPSFNVTNRAAALARLKTAGCVLVPVGPHAPGEFYVKDPHGIVFDVVERVS
jgi:catechol 2,3-dioxygenase-like lactoylglutathione lyase family enzyme